MAVGKYSRVDGRRSLNCCSTTSLVVFVAFCLVGVWMLMSTVVPIQNQDSSSEETVNEVKWQTTTDKDSKQFEDSSGELPETVIKRDDNGNDLRSESHLDIKNAQNVAEDVSVNTTEEKQEELVSKEESEVKTEPESENGVEGNQQEKLVEEKSDEKLETEEQTKTEAENDGDGKTNDHEASSGDGESNSEAGNTSDFQEGEKKLEGDETSDGIKQEDEVTIQTEKENVEKYQDIHSEESDSNNIESQETTAENEQGSTEVVESQNEKETQQSSLSEHKSGHEWKWKLCDVTAGPDYIPCLDNWGSIRKLPSTMHYEHRERHCPDEAPTCLVPLPEGYKRSIQWPTSREKIWYHNVPHTKLAVVKGHQNWVKVTGEYLTFPGGGTQFKNGALHYIDFIQKSLPDIAWGKRSRVILDVGCGVASFGGFLFDRDVLAMSFAPKDEHEAQVQFALERGIPAISAVMGTKRLPFPSSVYDLVHCARCRVPWHIEGGFFSLSLALRQNRRSNSFFFGQKNSTTQFKTLIFIYRPHKTLCPFPIFLLRRKFPNQPKVFSVVISRKSKTCPFFFASSISFPYDLFIPHASNFSVEESVSDFLQTLVGEFEFLFAMNSGPIDISSDEESGRNEKEDEAIYDWISELMDSIDNENDDDSDDVVVISEVNIKPKTKSSKPPVTDVDDDCVVLDGDPDKPVSVVDDSGSNSDELLVVGEKGQIACRDYPHPRHLCAKFPFKTTLHEKHCDLCHCYVCDSLAPCVHWGTGVSNIGHCHATDKEETWKILRKDSKIVKSSPPAPKLPAALPKLSQGPPRNIIRLAPSSILQNQVSRPTTIRACSSTSRTMPSVRNPGRSHQSEFILSKNRAHPCSVSKQLVGARNNVVGRNRGHNIDNLGPQFVSSHPMFKRVGAVGGTLPVNRTTFGSANNSSCTSPSQYGRNSAPMAASSDRKHFRWQNVPSTVHQNSSQPMATFVGNTVPSQPQTCSPRATIFDSVFNTNFPDQGNHRQNDSYISQYGNQSQDASQGGYQYVNQSQNSSQNICLQDNLCASVADMGFSDCNYSWVDNSSQSIQHPPIQQPPFQPPPVETSQIQSTEPIYVPSLVKEQSNEIANVSLDSQLNWLLENQSVPAVTSDSVPSHLNVLSPEPTFIEPGMLMFDFETSWNGLTEV